MASRETHAFMPTTQRQKASLAPVENRESRDSHQYFTPLVATKCGQQATAICVFISGTSLMAGLRAD